MKTIIHSFLKKIQPEYPEKLSVEYKRTGSAIPLSMADKYAESIALAMGDKYQQPILMQAANRKDSIGPVIEEV